MVKRAYVRRKPKASVVAAESSPAHEVREHGGGGDERPELLKQGDEGGAGRGESPNDLATAISSSLGKRVGAEPGRAPGELEVEGTVGGSEVRRGADVPESLGGGSAQAVLGVSSQVGQGMTPQAAPQEVKKGNRTWRPAHQLSLYKKTPGYRYRFCNNDPDNIERKYAEGWRLVNRVTGAIAEHYEEYGQITGGLTHRGMVLMALTEELGKQRDEYFQERTRKQSVSAKDRLQAKMNEAADATGAPKAQTHGTVTIS